MRNKFELFVRTDSGVEHALVVENLLVKEFNWPKDMITVTSHGPGPGEVGLTIRTEYRKDVLTFIDEVDVAQKNLANKKKGS
jgi:hypothetical protein